MLRNRSLLATLAASLFLLAVPATAWSEEAAPPRQFIGLGGTDQGSSSSYSYLGVLTPLSGRFTGNDWVLRGWLDYLTYDTDDAFGDLKARVYGGNVGISRSFPAPAGAASIGAGLVYGNRQYDRETTQDDEGGYLRFRVQGDYFGEPLERNYLNLFWSVSIPETEVFARGDWLYGFTGFRVGPSATWQQGQDYQSLRVGLTVQEIEVTDWARIGVGGGWEHTDTGNGIYGGVNFTLLLGFE
jgi:hypothetical protein